MLNILFVLKFNRAQLFDRFKINSFVAARIECRFAVFFTNHVYLLETL